MALGNSNINQYSLSELPDSSNKSLVVGAGSFPLVGRDKNKDILRRNGLCHIIIDLGVVAFVCLFLSRFLLGSIAALVSKHTLVDIIRDN